MRLIWATIGVFALLLGGLGLVLPLLPTTPFVLLAAFAPARSSDRWHGWLLDHRVFGPMIADWRAHRAISGRSRALSVLAMGGAFAGSVAIGASGTVLVIQAVVLTTAAAFVLSRPSPPRS